MTSRGFLSSAALLLALLGLAGCTGTLHSGRIARTGLNGGMPDEADQARSEADLETRISATAHYATGLSYELNDQTDLALEEFLKAAYADLGNDAVVIATAQRLLRAQKSEQAARLLGKAVALPDPSGALYVWLGLAYAQAGKTDLAISANRTAIRKQPQALAAYQNLSRLFLQNNRPNEALRVLDDAARQPTDNPGFLLELAELYTRYGRAQTNQNQVVVKRVQSALDRAAALHPDNPMHLLRLADSYLALGESKKAEPLYLDLLEHYSDLPSVRAKLTDIYLRAGQKEKASQQLEAISQSDPTNPRPYLLLGALAVEAKKFTEAADFYERAHKLAPDDEQLYYRLAGLKLTLDQPKEALALMQKAAAKFKLNFSIEYYSGLAYSALENYSEALNHLTSAEILAKANDPALLKNHFFYFQLGSVCERSGRIEDAEKNFQKSLELAPDNPETLNYLGYMWADKGIKLEQAHKLIEKAVQIEPDNAAFLDSLGWVLFKLGQPEAALPHILKAVEKANKPDPVLFDHLGDIYAALQQHEKACAAWKQALQLEPNDQIRQKLNTAPAAKASVP